ncbi:MAG: hypothetical protein KAX84_11525 [Burkholderiales bacterium]|nr:hypothetical protein [Burkholderiales bacterium]
MLDHHMPRSGKPAPCRRSLTGLPAALAALVMLVALGGTATAIAGIKQWTTNGPYGGDIRTVAVDPSAAGTIYAGGYGGVFKTTNGGANWSPANAGFSFNAAPYLLVTALAIDPVSPQTLFAGETNGIYKSTDGGASWSAAGLALVGSLVDAVAIDPAAPNKVYAAGNGGIYRSNDGGNSWTKSVAGLNGARTYSIAVAPAAIYAGTNGGVFKSSDGGATWTAANTGFGAGSPWTFHIAVDPVAPATVYAARNGLYKSIDGGGNWTKADAGIAEGEVIKFALDPQTPATLYAGAFFGGVYKSTDGGASWTAARTGLGKRQINALAVDARGGGTVVAGTADGVFRSADGAANWAEANHGLANVFVVVVAVDPLSPVTVYAGTRGQGVFKSTDGGGSWVNSSNGLREFSGSTDWIVSLAIDPVTPATVYAGTNYFVFKSIDGGANWLPSRTGVSSYLQVASLAIDPANPSHIVAGTLNGGVHRSNDAGASWITVSTGMPEFPSVLGLSFGKTTPPSLWAAVHPRFGGGDSIMNSTDGGATWSSTYPGFNPTGSLVSALDFLLNTAKLSSLTLGSTESFIPSFTPPFPATTGADLADCLPITILLLDPNSANAGYVGGACGVLQGTSAQLTAINSGLPAGFKVNSLAITPSGNVLYAALDGGSVYQYSAGNALGVVTEFYNTPLDNYFITADPNEAAAIDNGSAGPGWARTGAGFNFNSGGDTYVCRFYGSIVPGPNSHFYTVSSPECDGLKALQASTPLAQPRWNFESLDFISTPPVNGACPAGTVPVYRAYNNGLARRVDSNHRITASAAGIAEVVARGWVSEGIVMCAPQ